MHALNPIINHPTSEYFHALIEFERDPLPAASACDTHGEAFGDQHRPAFGAGSAQPLVIRNHSGGGCAEEFCTLSQLAPLVRV